MLLTRMSQHMQSCNGAVVEDCVITTNPPALEAVIPFRAGTALY